MTTQRHIAVQVRPAAPAVLGYVAVRMVGLVALWGAGGYSWPAFWGSLTEQYDADWLLAVASSGYDDGRDAQAILPSFRCIRPWCVGWVPSSESPRADSSSAGGPG